MNQDVEITYLEGRRDALVEAIGMLSGSMVGDLKEQIDDYSKLDDSETKTNAAFKRRLQKQNVREQNQKERVARDADRL